MVSVSTQVEHTQTTQNNAGEYTNNTESTQTTQNAVGEYTNNTEWYWRVHKQTLKRVGLYTDNTKLCWRVHKQHRMVLESTQTAQNSVGEYTEQCWIVLAVTLATSSCFFRWFLVRYFSGH